MKERNERAIGDKFIAFYDNHHGTSFTFKKRPSEAPDLTYLDGTTELNIEVGAAYYDRADAILRWEIARGSSSVGRRWSGIDFEEQMVRSVSEIIEQKCQKDYGPSCALVVHVRPMLTTVEDMRQRLDEIELPSRRPFDYGIYLSGDFADGHSCWRIDAA